MSNNNDQEPAPDLANSSTISAESMQNVPVEKLWDEIGFHKPLANLWFGLGFNIIGMLVSIIFVGPLLNLFYPYPEVGGYRGTATGIFGLFFTILDLGTNATMDRFIAAEAIKSPKTILKYIQYFVWYKLYMAMVKMTVITIWALYMGPSSQLAYGIWIMVFLSGTQWPGILGTGLFNGIMGSLQHYNKTIVVDFISGQVFHRIIELAFLLLGRWYGMVHPEIGEILGMIIGGMIGPFIADIFVTFVAAHVFTKVMAPYGFKIRDMFRHDFGGKEIKECALFGIKTGMPGLIGNVSGLIMLWECIIFIPQYTTFAALSGIAGGVAGLVNMAPGVGTNIIAEAYLNGKKKLTQYYASQAIRYAALFQGFFTPLILVVNMFLTRALIEFGVTNYLLAIPFVIPQVLVNLQQPYTSLCDTLMTGTNHPTGLMLIRFFEESLKVLFTTTWLVILQLPRTYGLSAIIWILPCGVYPAILTKTTTLYVHINRTIVKIKVAWWQTLGVPLICGGILYLVDLVLVNILFNNVAPIIGFLPVAVIAILGMLALGDLYFALSGALGGWDDDTLREFEKSTRMSGPSKFLVVPMFWLTKTCARHSKLHNRFSLPMKDAIQEARELLDMKHRGLLKIQPKKR